MAIPRVRLTVPNLSVKKYVPICVQRQLTVDLIHNIQDRVVVYHQMAPLQQLDRRVPSSYLSMVLKVECVYPIRSLTAAELYALLMAMEYIASAHSRTKWVIISDSQAALQSLISAGTTSAGNPVVADVVKLHAVAAGHMFFQWLPGHCGIPGHHAADAAARRAYGKRASRLIYFTKSDARAMFTVLCRELAEAQWLSGGARASLLHRVDPELASTFPTSFRRPFASLYHRLRLNVPCSRRLLHKLGKADSPNCGICGTVEDTEHILLSCPRYQQHR
ncbi:uncharacterized protein LOC135385011 [Ornithodoros turicata]|uniref:uncharacterized protein LOC135385011 n=1 Tax=Ornithodoros turicata TaxID=34597 RepID=UPI0031387AD2